jgi:hypothetical protein
MRHIVSATLGLGLALAGMAAAEDRAMSEPVVVVELYTSQGCSSCPPADEYLTSLAKDARVVPLALHVDYWDYIGWKDSFANPKFTERQKAYARVIGSRTIYTPQMIVGGVDRVEGHDPGRVNALLKRQLGADRQVDLSVERRGDVAFIRAEALRPLDGPMRVQLVRYDPEETVSIERGENAGHQITYHNIVTSWQVLGEWSGGVPLSVEAAVPGRQPIVVILQASGPAAIVAAARID